MIYNTFGWPFTSHDPGDRPGQSAVSAPSGIGVLASMDGVGAVCGAIAIAPLGPGPGTLRGSLSARVAIYLVMLPVFALAPIRLLAGLRAAADGSWPMPVSASCRRHWSILRPRPRCAAASLACLSVCIGIGMIGFLHLGWLAGLIGAAVGDRDDRDRGLAGAAADPALVARGRT